jgi:hypothetical protein
VIAVVASEKAAVEYNLEPKCGSSVIPWQRRISSATARDYLKRQFGSGSPAVRKGLVRFLASFTRKLARVIGKVVGANDNLVSILSSAAVVVRVPLGDFMGRSDASAAEAFPPLRPAAAF